MSEQPLSVSPAVFLVIFCRGDVATYGESERAEEIWQILSGVDADGQPGAKRNGLQMYSRWRVEGERREIKKRNVS